MTNAHKYDDAHIDHRVSEEGQRDRAGEEPREESRRVCGDHEPAHDERQVQDEEDGVADQSEFLRGDREDEVGGPLRDELEMRLRPLEPTLADDAARTYRDRGLD